MGTPTAYSAPNAIDNYAPATEANNALQNKTLSLASLNKPQQYVFDPNRVINNTQQYSGLQANSNLNALAKLNPAAYAGYESGISGVAGGSAADDQFLRNNALKSGLAQGAYNGTIQNGYVGGPSSVGGVTAENVYGQDLLSYENQRRQQQIALGQGLMPQTTPDPGQLASAQEQNMAQNISNNNQFNNMLQGLQFNQDANLNNQLQQNIGITQNALNANAANMSNASSAGSGQNAALAGAGLAAAGTIGAAALL